MSAWILLIELARDLGCAKHRPARVQDGLDLQEHFWQLPQGLDLRSHDGHRAENLSGIVLKVFILKLRGVWITSIRWVLPVNGLGWARPRFAGNGLGIAKFDHHAMQDLHVHSRHCPASDVSPHAPYDAMPRPTQGFELSP